MPAGKFDVCVFPLYFFPAMCLIQHSHKISYKLHIALFLSLFLRRFFFVFVIFRWTKNAFIHTFCHGLICSTFWYSNGIVGDSRDESYSLHLLKFPFKRSFSTEKKKKSCIPSRPLLVSFAKRIQASDAHTHSHICWLCFHYCRGNIHTQFFGFSPAMLWFVEISTRDFYGSLIQKITHSLRNSFASRYRKHLWSRSRDVGFGLRLELYFSWELTIYSPFAFALDRSKKNCLTKNIHKSLLIQKQTIFWLRRNKASSRRWS